MHRFRRAAVILAASSIMAGMSACGAAGRSVRVAVVGPMTGEQAKQGKDMADGARLAVAEWNAKGGVLGRPVELLMGDDAQDPKQANSLANKMWTRGVVLVVGHYNSSCTIPASEIYNLRHMVMITPASTNPKVTDRGYKTLFRICGRDDQQGMVGARYVVRAMPNAKVAVLHDKTTYGQGLADEFLKNYEQMSSRKVVYYGAIVKEDQDYSAVLTSLKALDPDLLYFGGLYPQAGLLVRQMRQLGLKATLMAGDGTYDPEFIRIAGANNAEGSLLTFMPDQEKIPGAQAVISNYRKRFGEVGPYSLYSYEAMNIGLAALSKAGALDGLKAAAVIHASSFDTVFGPIRFDAKGDVLESPYVVWRVESGRLVQIPRQ
ncbi:MAG: branched-chain amino acid ABC transporter substrate-binding protein [Acidobacteria bacterium]|nr:branched-chain amino acid ABC transporter substrate-binding protein [Acidobacteriota bacterium]